MKRIILICLVLLTTTLSAYSPKVSVQSTTLDCEGHEVTISKDFMELHVLGNSYILPKVSSSAMYDVYGWTSTFHIVIHKDVNIAMMTYKGIVGDVDHTYQCKELP